MKLLQLEKQDRKYNLIFYEIVKERNEKLCSSKMFGN